MRKDSRLPLEWHSVPDSDRTQSQIRLVSINNFADCFSHFLKLNKHIQQHFVHSKPNAQFLALQKINFSPGNVIIKKQSSYPPINYKKNVRIWSSKRKSLYGLQSSTRNRSEDMGVNWNLFLWIDWNRDFCCVILKFHH